MKILLLTPFYSPGVGGSSRLLTETVEHLRSRGNTVTVITYNSEPSAALAAYDEKQPYPIIRIYPKAGLTGSSSLQLLQRAIQLIKKEQFDLILSGVAYSTGIIAFLAAQITRIPFVVYSYGEDVTVVGDSGRKRQVLSLALRAARHTITISEFTRDKICQLGVPANRVSIVPPGIDPTPYISGDQKQVSALRTRFGLEGKRVILTVARLTPRKGHDTIVRTIHRLAEEVPNVHYLIVGGGDRAPLEALAREEGVQDRVTIIDYVPDEELPLLYYLGDVYAMVSRWDHQSKEVEGFGIVYLEAAACGKPCVAGSHGGSPDAVENGRTGFVVDPTSVEEVYGALRTLLTDPANAAVMGERGRERVIRNFQKQTTLSRAGILITGENRQVPVAAGVPGTG